MNPVQYLEVDVGLLRPNSFNPNRVSAQNEKKIRASLERNGLFKPIIVREVSGQSGYEIIGGQHRWEQARELGMKTVMVANLGMITNSRAKEIGLLDNARYGADDALLLSEILKDIGTTDEIQTFLPYGDTDLASIFATSDIDLESLNVVREDEKDAFEDDIPEEKTTKPAKTHTTMRFRLSNMDAERVTKLIATTQRDQDFNTADDLTNAGDALVFLLLNGQAPDMTGRQDVEDLGSILDQIEAAQKEIES
jgi:ParB-like chromosome segregation protein Spo0J